jgi:glucokinase
MHKDSIISIDMGGTKMLGCAINSTDNIFARVKFSVDPDTPSKEYIKSLVELVNTVTEEGELKQGQVKAVCIGVPGTVNPVTGVIGLAPNLGLKNFKIKALLEKEIHIPVLIENDVNLGALGIKNFGVGKDADNLLAVFIGTGIGGGLILNGKLFRGANYSAGEVGHILVEENGPQCGCGKNGCFEAIASRTAIVNNIINDVKSGKKSVLEKMVTKGERIKSKALAKALTDGDKVVMNRVSEVCNVIGGVLASITNLLNLEMIVLGGGLIEAADDFMMPKIKKAFDSHVLSTSAEGMKILASKLADDAAIFGGIAIAEEFLGMRV